MVKATGFLNMFTKPVLLLILKDRMEVRTIVLNMVFKSTLFRPKFSKVVMFIYEKPGYVCSILEYL